MTADTPVSIDELLAHRDWVRGLARALVRDANDADDLAQDAWQRALRSPPRVGGSVRSWFATVLRNRASELRRNDARRGARSGGGTDPDTVAGRSDCSPAELAERAELERRVLSIVNDLDPAHRDVVLLRFWSGLGADEIAALRGIAPATARTRLHRALAQVRERLDGELGGRDAWRAALLPIAAFRAEEGAGAATQTASASRLVAGLAICAIVVGAAWLAAARWPASGGTPTGGVPSARSAGATPRAAAPAAPRGRARTAAAPVAPDAPVAATPATPTAVSTTENVAITPAHVHVRVADSAGRSVAGARVVTARTDGGKSGRVVTMSGETGADGEVELAWAGEPATVRALAQFGATAGVSEAFDIEPGATVGTGIQLGEAQPVSGRVVRPDGTAAPGAYVMLYGPIDDRLEEIAAVTADADGRFDFGPIPVGLVAEGSLESAAAGFPRAWTVLREAGAPSAVTVRLDEPMVVIGRLIDERGAPVAGVTVDVTGANTSLTDAQGRFRTEPIRPAKARAVILPDDHAPRAIDLGDGATGTRDLGDVVLVAGLPIRGRVVSSDGAPVPGAFVWIDDIGADQIVRQGTADAEGRFAFEHLGPGPHAVHAQAHDDGSAFAGHEGVTTDVRAGDVATRVVVGPGLSVRVDLVDAETGEPVSVRDFTAALLSPDDPNVGARTSFGGDAVRSVRMSMKTAGPADLTIDVPGYETFGPERVEIAAHEERRIVARLKRRE